ncbi:hypothetical protein GGF31_007596 [Allomyces arbusculus]|nr:hypothetical protein GGF31_007596 [Allomyces arbusculus]
MTQMQVGNATPTSSKPTASMATDSFVHDLRRSARSDRTTLVATHITSDPMHPIYASLSSSSDPLTVITVTGDARGATRDVYRQLAASALNDEKRVICLPDDDDSPHDPRLFGLLFCRGQGTLLLLLAHEWAAGAAYVAAFNVLYVTNAAVVNWDLYSRLVAGVGALANESRVVVPEEWTSGDDDGHDIVDAYYFQGSDGDSSSSASDSEDEEVDEDDGIGFDSDTTSVHDDEMDATIARLVPPQLAIVFPHFELAAPADFVQRDIQHLFSTLLPSPNADAKGYPIFSRVSAIVARGDLANNDSTIFSSILANAQIARIQAHSTGTDSTAPMSCHTYATLLQRAMTTAETSRTPSSSSMFTRLAQDHAHQQLDDAVDAYRSAMADVLNDAQYYDRPTLIAKHVTVMQSVHAAFCIDHESWTLDLNSRLRTELDRITAATDRAAAQFNRAVAETEWNRLVSAIDDKVYLGTGLEAARVVADLVAAWETSYRERARGPTATPVIMEYMRSQARWIASVVDLARVQAELADEEVEKMREMAEVVRENDVARIAIMVEALVAVEAQVQAEADALAAELGTSAEAAMDAVRKEYAARGAELDRQLQRALDAAVVVAQESVFDADALAKDLSDRLDRARETVDTVGKDLTDAAAMLKQMQRDQIRQDQIRQDILRAVMTGASVIGGIALLVHASSLVGTVVGSMLLSAGIATTMHLVAGDGKDSWGEAYATGAAVGLAAVVAKPAVKVAVHGLGQIAGNSMAKAAAPLLAATLTGGMRDSGLAAAAIHAAKGTARTPAEQVSAMAKTMRKFVMRAVPKVAPAPPVRTHDPIKHLNQLARDRCVPADNSGADGPSPATKDDTCASQLAAQFICGMADDIQAKIKCLSTAWHRIDVQQ